MKKNGFTLIELLAVVVVLAIILVVASPKIFNAVEESNKLTFLRSSESIVNEANKLYVSDNINISQNGKEFTIENNAFVGDSIDVSGELPDSGKIYIDQEGGTAILLRKGDYCVYKDFSEKEITISSNYASCVLNIPEVVPDTCFTRTNDGVQVTITSYSYSCSKNVIIPDTLDGFPVRIIGNSAFSSRGLNSVKLSNSVTTINENAFRYNNLKKIVIPDSVTYLGIRAFYSNMISNLTLSNSVTKISEMAFASNQLVDLVIPDNIQIISFGSFGINPLQKIHIGSGLNYFEYFNGTYQPDNKNAFSGTDNLEITISPLNTTYVALDGGIYTKDMKKIVFGTPSVLQNIPSSVEIIGRLAFANMDISNIVIPSNIKSIDFGSFYNCGAVNVSLSSGLTGIGQIAFADNSLTNVVFPNTLKTISYEAFKNNLLTSVTIPNSVTTISPGAFNNNLLPNNQAFIYARNLDGTENTTKIISYGGAERNNVNVPNGVIIIDEDSFRNSGIKNVTIPSSVTTINSGAFRGNDLTNLILSNNVTSLGTGAFSYNQLISLTISNSSIVIGSVAFVSNKLTNVVIPTNTSITSNSISSTFYTAYVTNNASAGGTYTATSQDGIWTKQP